MARAIGWRLTQNQSLRTTRSVCSYCGASWYTDDLRRDRAGNLVCPNEGDGRDVVALGEDNARASAAFRPPEANSPQGPYYDVENGTASGDATINKTRADVLGS